MYFKHLLRKVSILGFALISSIPTLGATVTVDGDTTKVASVIKEGVTFVGVRDMADLLNVKLDHDPATGKIILGNRLEIIIGTGNYVLDDLAFESNTQPLVENGSTYLPLRLLSELLGYHVTFIDEQISLTTLDLTYKTKNKFSNFDFATLKTFDESLDEDVHFANIDVCNFMKYNGEREIRNYQSIVKESLDVMDSNLDALKTGSSKALSTDLNPFYASDDTYTFKTYMLGSRDDLEHKLRFYIKENISAGSLEQLEYEIRDSNTELVSLYGKLHGTITYYTDLCEEYLDEAIDLYDADTVNNFNE